MYQELKAVGCNKSSQEIFLRLASFDPEEKTRVLWENVVLKLRHIWFRNLSGNTTSFFKKSLKYAGMVGCMNWPRLGYNFALTLSIMSDCSLSTSDADTLSVRWCPFPSHLVYWELIRRNVHSAGFWIPNKRVNIVTMGTIQFLLDLLQNKKNIIGNRARISPYHAGKKKDDEKRYSVKGKVFGGYLVISMPVCHLSRLCRDLFVDGNGTF